MTACTTSGGAGPSAIAVTHSDFRCQTAGLYKPSDSFAVDGPRPHLLQAQDAQVDGGVRDVGVARPQRRLQVRQRPLEQRRSRVPLPQLHTSQIRCLTMYFTSN